MRIKNNDVSSNREKFLIAVFFIAVLCTCLFKLGGIAALGTIRSLYLEQAMIRAEIEQLNTVLASEQQLTGNYLETTLYRQHDQHLIPLVDQQPVSIGALEKLINSGPGRLHAMRVNESIDYGNYSAQNIFIKITNLETFPSSFIYRLENFTQLLIIEHIEWLAGESETGTISLSLNLYYLN